MSDYRPTRIGWALIGAMAIFWAVNVAHLLLSPGRSAPLGGPWWALGVIALANVVAGVVLIRARLDTAVFAIALLWYVALVLRQVVA